MDAHPHLLTTTTTQCRHVHWRCNKAHAGKNVVKMCLFVRGSLPENIYISIFNAVKLLTPVFLKGYVSSVERAPVDFDCLLPLRGSYSGWLFFLNPWLTLC